MTDDVLGLDARLVTETINAIKMARPEGGNGRTQKPEWFIGLKRLVL